MIELIKGCKISGIENIKEEYKIEKNWIFANVTANKILKLIYEFIELQKDKEPLFMFFEIPCTKTEEDELKKTRPKEMTSDGFYYNVYYLDNVSKNFIKEILSMMGEVLLNDGLSSFGVGNFTTGDEIGKYKYNEVKILTENTKKYEKLLKNNEIKRNDEVVLARYLTSKDNPGVCTRYKDSEGRDVYKIVDALKEVEGFYKYSMRNNVTQDEVIIE